MRTLVVAVTALALAACGGHSPVNPDGGGGGAGGCDVGYTSQNGMCVDVDECATTKPCAANATCTNSPGSFTCACPSGFTGDGLTCVKLNATPLSAGFAMIDSDRTLWAWGNGYALGERAGIAAPLPVRLSADSDWEDVSFGEYGLCAVKTTGTLWCVGSASQDSFGLGAAQAYITLADLTQIGTDTDWADVELDRENGCAIKKDGSLYCWGHDNYGETGQGKPAADTLTETPTKVGTATNWKQVSLAYGTALAIDATGALWCWGNNQSGDCAQGMGSATTFNTPTRVGTETSWAQVHADITTCAVKTDGTLWCWVRSARWCSRRRSRWAPTPTGPRSWAATRTPVHARRAGRCRASGTTRSASSATAAR